MPEIDRVKRDGEKILGPSWYTCFVNMKSRSKTVAVTFKTSPDTLFKLEQIAELRGMTRSTLLDLMSEAVVDGRLALEIPGRFARYSTGKNAPNVVKDERIEARLVDLEAQDVARIEAVIAASKKRLKRIDLPETVSLKGWWLDA